MASIRQRVRPPSISSSAVCLSSLACLIIGYLGYRILPTQMLNQ